MLPAAELRGHSNNVLRCIRYVMGLELYRPQFSVDLVFARCLPQIGQEDIVYDFGCGDGRFLVEAVKSSRARGVRIRSN